MLIQKRQNPFIDSRCYKLMVMFGKWTQIHNLTRTMTETMGITSLKQKECPTRQWKSNGVEVLQNAKDPDTCQCGI